MTEASDRGAAPLADFAGIYAAHARDLRRFALYLSGDAALADDLVSEAFVRAWTVRERVELPTVRAYLFTIVRNLFLHHVRDERRHEPLDPGAPDGRPGPEERASDQRDLAVVLSALRALPEIDRAALLMRADEQVSYEEISAALGITVTAAKVKVHRARLKLAEARLAGRGPARAGRGTHEHHT
jgi:RNA polymerase sigma-70 factor, ECF subfamily